jgi:flagellar basal-body M-ring protein/flagellar hook-basal body protein (fliF)
VAEAASEKRTDLMVNSDPLDKALDSQAPKSSSFKFLSNLDLLRQVTLILGLLICIAIAVFIFMWGNEPDMRPVGHYSTADMIKTLDYMDQQKIPYKVQDNTILVRATDYSTIRLQLQRQGFAPSADENSGDALLMKDPGFGVSQRMESERLKLSREQQLARAIEQFQGIDKATVLLAIPKDNVFARNDRQPSATVVLVLKSAALKQEAVDSIVDTVASAVHGLEPSRVTVTDQNGRLLNSGSQDLLSARSRKEFEMQQKQEAEYKQKIDDILSPVLGLDNYTAEVDATLDFSQEEQTRRMYNPDLPAVRSEVTMEENNVGNGATGVPGALSNQPPANAQIPESTSQGSSSATSGRSRKEATRNYELDTTISHVQRQTGSLRRLTVSVAVDYKAQTGADGKVTRQARTQAELDTIRRLLQGGLGFDVSRGDQIEVVSIPFHRPDVASIPDTKLWEKDWFWPAVRIGASIILILILLVTVVRPVMKKLMNAEPQEDSLNVDLDSRMALEGNDELSLLASQADSEEPVFGMRNGQLVLPDLHRDEDLLRAVRALVSNEPDLAAQVIKEWVSTKD